MVRSRDIPQANDLARVREIVSCIANGFVEKSDQQVLSGLGPRHVNYYREAARILGLVRLGGSTELTLWGGALLKAIPGSRAEAQWMGDAIRSAGALRQAVGDYLSEPDVTADALTTRIVQSTGLSPSTARRRADCLMSWRETVLEGGWAPRAPRSDIGLLEVRHLQLTGRASKLLDHLGVRFIGQLVGTSPEAILAAPNSGRRTLERIRHALAELDLTLGSANPMTEAKIIVARSGREPELDQLRRSILDRRFGLAAGASADHEIQAILRAVVRPSHVPKVEMWMGLVTGTPETLQSSGDALGLTRERIRQVVDGASRTLDSLDYAPPALIRAAEVLQSAAPTTARAAEAKLAGLGLLTPGLSASTLIRAAKLFGVDLAIEVFEHGNETFVGTDEDRERVMRIDRAARRAIARWGCCTVEDVAAETESGEALVAAALLPREDFAWLDEDTGWFWLTSVPRNRVLNQIEKVLSVTDEVDLRTLRTAVARPTRMEGFAPPLRVLRAICDQFELTAVRSGDLVALVGPRPAALSDIEESIVGVFEELGPAVTMTEAVAECTARGLSQISATIYISSRAIFRRIDRGVYSVVGATLSPGQVQTKAARVKKRTRVGLDGGLDEHGSSVWATYRISESLFQSGVLHIPSRLRRFVADGRYAIATDSGVGRDLNVSSAGLSGLAPMFRRQGAEPGDYLRVTLNTDAMTAAVELSPESFEDD